MKHHFQLVLASELWERLKALARRNRRPISEEARIAIEDHVDKADEEKGDPPKESHDL